MQAEVKVALREGAMEGREMNEAVSWEFMAPADYSIGRLKEENHRLGSLGTNCLKKTALDPNQYLLIKQTRPNNKVSLTFRGR